MDITCQRIFKTSTPFCVPNTSTSAGWRANKPFSTTPGILFNSSSMVKGLTNPSCAHRQFGGRKRWCSPNATQDYHPRPPVGATPASGITESLQPAAGICPSGKRICFHRRYKQIARKRWRQFFPPAKSRAAAFNHLQGVVDFVGTVYINRQFGYFAQLHFRMPHLAINSEVRLEWPPRL